MKLLAVSLVAAASAATNYTAVYGVHPPGLGAGVFSGLSNTRQWAVTPSPRPQVVRGLAGLDV